MIKIERFKEPTLDIYSSDGYYCGTLYNQHEFNKFRIKMLETNATADYYFMWEGIRINVRENGDMDKFPVGMYDQVQRDLAEVHRLNVRRLNADRSMNALNQKHAGLDKYFKDLELYEKSFHCNQCGCDEIADFIYDRRVGNGEVWHCKHCKTEMMVDDRPNEDNY